MSALFQGLFQGAQRVGALCATRGASWSAVAPFVRAFPRELDGYAEVSLDPRSDLVGLSTRGEGQAFAFRVARWLEIAGVSEVRLRRLLARSSYLEHRNLFVGVTFDGGGVRTLSYAFRGQHPLDVAAAWLADEGVEPSGRRPLGRCAERLGKSTARWLGSDELGGDELGGDEQRVTFSQPVASASWARIAAAAADAGIDEAGWAALKARRAGLAACPLFWSLRYAGAAQVAGGLLEICDVSLAEAGALIGDAAPVEGMLALMEADRLDRVSVRLTPGAPMGVRLHARVR